MTAARVAKKRSEVGYAFILVTIGAAAVFLWAAPAIFVPLLERFLVMEPQLNTADALVLMAGNRHERLPAVARLYREGAAPRIYLTNDGVFSAWSSKLKRNLYEVEWTEQDLVKLGVPEIVVLKLPFSLSGTIHDAQHAMAAARNQGLDSLIVVTSDYHTRRTLWSFRNIAGDGQVLISPWPVRGEESGQACWHRLSVLTIEAFKYLYYQLRY